jgi:hypothetical protein
MIAAVEMDRPEPIVCMDFRCIANYVGEGMTGIVASSMLRLFITPLARCTAGSCRLNTKVAVSRTVRDTTNI